MKAAEFPPPPISPSTSSQGQAHHHPTHPLQGMIAWPNMRHDIHIHLGIPAVEFSDGIPQIQSVL